MNNNSLYICVFACLSGTTNWPNGDCKVVPVGANQS